MVCPNYHNTDIVDTEIDESNKEGGLLSSNNAKEFYQKNLSLHLDFIVTLGNDPAPTWSLLM